MTETPLRWQIGDVRITRIAEGQFDLPSEMLFPTSDATELAAMDWLKPHFFNADGTLTLSIHALLIETPSLRIVVDTCMGNDKVRQYTGNLLATDFLDRFATSGISPDLVDVVLCTHLHSDHVGWNTTRIGDRWVPTFPNARYLFGADEFAYWKDNPQTDDDRALFADSLLPIVDAGLADFVASDHRLCAEVSLIPTPGHTPGHVSVIIESQGQRAMITGDATHHPCQWTRTEWASLADVDAAGSTDTRQRLCQELADQPVLVIGTHYPAPTAGHVVTDAAGFRFVA
ncbi:MAG: fold metallo-hydrolase [Sphingomonadales bacterium]|nr:fold metallo-hydrolase [Sphingomonadales bacterium]